LGSGSGSGWLCDRSAAGGNYINGDVSAVTGRRHRSPGNLELRNWGTRKLGNSIPHSPEPVDHQSCELSRGPPPRNADIIALLCSLGAPPPPRTTYTCSQILRSSEPDLDGKRKKPTENKRAKSACKMPGRTSSGAINFKVIFS